MRFAAMHAAFFKITVTFFQISRKLQLLSWNQLNFPKGNEQTFPTVYCPYINIVNFPHTSRIHFCFQNTPFKPMGRKAPETLGARELPSNTPIPRSTPLTTPNGIQMQSAVFTQYTLQTDKRPTDRQTDRQTDRPTDRWDRPRRQVCTNTRLYTLHWL